MFANDVWISQQATEGMIEPFEPNCIREVKVADSTDELRKVLSFGTSSFGYDFRVGERLSLYKQNQPNLEIDVKKYDSESLLEPCKIQEDNSGRYFRIPPHGFALGISLEKFKIPPNVVTICVGKSTYCRAGLILNISPMEPSWEGYLVTEIYNSTGCYNRLYIEEGLGQILFAIGDLPAKTYGDRQGKYQNQPSQIITPRM